MLDFMKSMPPRSLTFFERMRLTYALFSMGLPMPVEWLTIVWSIGARVSSSPIDQRSVKLSIETKSGYRYVTVTISKRQVTA